MRAAALAFSLLLCAAARAQGPEGAAPPSFPRGERMVREYFREQVRDISDRCLSGLTAKEGWEKGRPELRRQFFEMMGLWPLPPRTALKATVTGTAEGEGFTVEKVHFQSSPDLYVTANFYLPKGGKGGKRPAVLYVCGHGNVVADGVSYGSKAFYRYHPARLAARGYACLVLDTLELGELPGTHHGTSRLGMWWWQARGYTPAGVECWNAMRALDYLEARPEVDAARIGVTGRSGGGATSWWVAAADDRVAAVVPVAGICDLQSHLCEAPDPRLKDGVIAGHCDCMYPINSYRWDFAQVAALCAPRPLLLGNSDGDRIFPVAGYRRLAEKVRKVYALYGAEERFQLLETKGPHEDTPELRAGTDAWMDRWLKGGTATKPADDLPPKLAPRQLKVFERLPEGAANEALHEVFIKPAALELPESPAVAGEWWANRKPELLAALAEKSFGGWAKNPPPLKAVVAADLVRDGVRLRAVDFLSEAAVELRLFVAAAEGAGPPKGVVLSVLGDGDDWGKWCRDLGPDFADALLLDEKPRRDGALFAQNRAAMAAEGLAFAAICPRGVGPTQWAVPGSAVDVQFRRRFPLVGQTLDGQRVWDVRRAVRALRGLEGFEATPLTLQGRGVAAGVALYAALFEPTVAALDLWHLPPSHREGPTFLNVARVLDAPQAVALALPRAVTLHAAAAAHNKVWDWTERLAAATGAGGKLKRKVAGE